MADMYILSPDDQVLTVLSSDGQEACRFWDAKYKEELNKGSSFSFVADASHPDARYLFEENQVVFRDKDGILRLFVIKELDDTDENSEVNTLVTCEAAMMELAETFVKDFRPTDKTAQFVLDNVLARSRWVAEVSAELGTNSTTFYKKTALECIAEVINIWGGELQDSIEFDGNKIIKRIIKILPRRGKDSGKRFEIDKDTENIKRTVISYPLTALWGYGASIASTDEDGEETGGYSRFIDFSEVEWKKSKGDPVDKPLGQEWVGDPDLLKRLGRLKNGELIHREGQYNNEDITDPVELLKATYNHLITTASKTEVNYELSVQLLQNVPGYEHEHVELGDTTIAIDRNFAIPIETSQRIISMEYDITDPDNTCVVEIGQFLSVLQGDDRINQIENILDKNRGTWERKPDVGEVTDGSFPDIIPKVPSNVSVKGLFSGVSITWDYDPSSYIAAYEVYGSQIKGFTPSIENRLWRGKQSGYLHENAGVDNVWYYRIRAVNYHSKASEFTAEFSAKTQRIMTDDILFGAITADKLADLTITAEKLSTTLQGQNLLAGSMLRNYDETYRLNSSTRYLDTSKEFNEMRIVKTRTDEPLFGMTFTPRSKLNLSNGTTYTLSFELKRSTISDFSYLRIRVDGKEVYAIPNNLSDISSADPDQFLRYDVVFTPNITITNGALWIGATTANAADPGEFTIRKIQVREGDVRKEFAFSPYDTQLIDGAVTSAVIQDAAITSAKVAEAAIGTAAIQNAAIARAHLQEAIIDTVHIADAAITSAKIKELSADKITSGTINAINITGSLIRGGKFQALNTNNNFDSYFDGNKFYQYKRNSVYTGDGTYAEYTMTEINSALFYQENGKDYQDGSGKEVYRSVSIGNGKVSVKGSGEFTQAENMAVVEMYGDFNGFNGTGKIAITNDTAKNLPKDIFLLEGGYDPIDATGGDQNYFTNFNNRVEVTGSSSLISFKPSNFEVYVGGGLRMRSTKRTVFEGAPVELPKKSTVMPGDDQFTTPEKIVGGNVTSLVTDIHGALQNNLCINVSQCTVTVGSGSYGYGYVSYPMVDGNNQGAENVFAVMATPYGKNANNVTAGIMNQTANGFQVHVRGTGAKDVTNERITVRLVIFYEKK
ncbi:prophage endopeptidase tail family protein [Bacillus halotolerans]|uniref:prophage endopeptidase tail family protein n=1 Tax=Bacillus halotolerans TaxID=260554 RepID=UPI002DBAF339|nr:prophage endopeptidase tail family protein [Bacillus halotolerans]MEC1647112.1 prophage endopeptidase tail family protein [Bacillus halotolerans]